MVGQRQKAEISRRLRRFPQMTEEEKDAGNPFDSENLRKSAQSAANAFPRSTTPCGTGTVPVGSRETFHSGLALALVIEGIATTDGK